ncbi:GGDEF domain-containing protein [Paenibacillus roseipurpureus]|uniref:GGDEF domain-containing protein n=1 Tax=Paenibacillus roseopurpureus TaxID=2918901 RepID=A0AA96LNP2_9BACL|nr:GGDEF domain-containing protein [Paenibacillus sp. MBLB1832]WNR44472.1 GGDEF domain-containing protein [Paenibacillus sp. MBLB1832]
MVKTRKSDHILEITYSCVRWFLVVATSYLFLNYYHKTAEDLKLFCSMFVGAILYMGLTEFALHRFPMNSFFYRFMTRFGVVMDYFAFLSILGLTGGTHSYLYPIGFLVILHASLYWSFRGAMVATGMIILGYLFIGYWIDGGITAEDYPRHFMNVSFLLMIGVIGGIIVARERKHFVEKGIFENLAKQDYLTGLYNHRSFQEHMREIIISRRPMALAMGDIDYFKKINDEHGHQAGDAVLRMIGDIMDTLIPSAEGRAFRYGGEEFAIIFYTNDQARVTQLLQLLMEKLRMQTFYNGEETFRVTMSFGAVIRDQGQRKSELVAAADELLYQAKDQGKDRLLWAAQTV